MLKRDWLWFLRPTLGVMLCYFVAIGLSYLLSQRNVEELDQRLSVVNEFANAFDEIAKPSPELTPKEVTKIQATALSDPDQTRAALRCMCFASPENLIVTGPFERFKSMVRGSRFKVLSAPDALVVGDPIFQGDNARVLVTAIANEQVSAFVWVLAKQTEGAYQNCWMTDGVFPMLSNAKGADNEI